MFLCASGEHVRSPVSQFLFFSLPCWSQPQALGMLGSFLPLNPQPLRLLDFFSPHISMWRSEDILWELVLFFQLWTPGIELSSSGFAAITCYQRANPQLSCIFWSPVLKQSLSRVPLQPIVCLVVFLYLAPSDALFPVIAAGCVFWRCCIHRCPSASGAAPGTNWAFFF